MVQPICSTPPEEPDDDISTAEQTPSKEQVELLLLALKLKHGLTNKAVEDIMKLFNLSGGPTVSGSQ